MPQMSPMNWLWLMLMFSLVLGFSSAKIHFFMVKNLSGGALKVSHSAKSFSLVI